MMWIAEMVPDKTGHHRRTYECPRCLYVDTVVVAPRECGRMGGCPDQITTCRSAGRKSKAVTDPLATLSTVLV